MHLVHGLRSLSSREVPVTSRIEQRGIEPAEDLALRLGLSFSKPSLLTRALTHRSYVNEHPEAVEDNERLEFLGDAVLDFIVGAWVFQRFPEMLEGDLTKVRSALVRNERLAVFARQFDLGRAMRLGRGELSSGGRDRDNLLGSTFEAVIGAFYLEAGMKAVEAWITPLLENARETVLNEIQDPKSQFQEWTQAEKIGTPFYRVTGTSGPDHARLFEVEVAVGERVFGQGRGPSKQAAERAAAADALSKLGAF
jgi:ribonuclease-3